MVTLRKINGLELLVIFVGEISQIWPLPFAAPNLYFVVKDAFHMCSLNWMKYLLNWAKYPYRKELTLALYAL